MVHAESGKPYARVSTCPFAKEPAMSDTPAQNLPVTESADMIEEELLVEDVSIDGMCGVY